MNIKSAAIIIIVFFCHTIYGQSEKLVMDCSISIPRDDAATLNQAPLGAKRITKHHLMVNWARGSEDFIDKPPYDQDLDGISYAYCGYNSSLEMHLMRKSDYGNFTGVLLDNTTGKVIPAGQYVSFAKDKRKYFAAVQPDGLDGEEWYVYTRDGQLIWKGLSGISEKHPRLNYDFFVVELSNPTWNSAGELEATGICASERGNVHKKENKIRLQIIGNKWEWLPRISCPGMEGR